MTQQQNRTISHIHYDVTSLLNMNDKQLSECVSHPDGVEAARLDLQSMFDSGKTCLVLSGDCDSTSYRRTPRTASTGAGFQSVAYPQEQCIRLWSE